MAKKATAKPAGVTLTIDGQELTVPVGTTLLQAAQGAGTEVPHYCYHPGLSSPAMCRLCLVEVEGAPKLLPSCTTTVSDGQVVHTQSDDATRMRQGVLEFYLLNHPLDCPICDQSGECDLQDYVFAEGREHGRGREAKRVFGRDDLGGDILFYGDRCVMCTRCVRFMNEIEEKPLLTVVERGNRAVIDTFFDEGLEKSDWAGNVVDICPVGALVSKDFLHKARAWDLEHTPSICPNCSQGCNIDLHTRDNLVHRMKPRINLEVNGHWICDYGRSRYEWLNRGDRLEVPVMNAEGRNTAMSWTTALEALKVRIGALGKSSVKAVVSPFWSNEDLGAVSRLVETLGGGSIVFRSAWAEEEVVLQGYEGLARRKALAPNGHGAELLGCTRVGDDLGQGGLEDLMDHEGVVLVLGDALDDQPEDFAPNAGLVLYLGAYTSSALASVDFQLPVTTFAEQEGTFTNHAGRVQRFWPALSGPGAARPAWLVLGALVGALQGEDGPNTAEKAFDLVAQAIKSYKGLDYETIGAHGGPSGAPVPVPVPGD
ncbi:MAG: 2Fe-2S iron-sulfur cluster-binding protein [Gemmatimonadota bacterium]|nr:2Fe-2S iron-sulfur cluster-binding protein [Gemmatimonadota bacterium]